MSELLNQHRSRRARRVALIFALAVVSLAFGTMRGSAANFELPTVAVTLSQPVVETGQDVTLTATVTATSGYPAGTIAFSTIDDPLDTIGSPVVLHAVGGTTYQSEATLTTSFAGGRSYGIFATYVPPADGSFRGANSQASPVVLTVSQTIPHTTTTRLAVSPTPVVQGADEQLTATVTADDGSIPTGKVYFYDGATTLGSQDLDAGVATFNHVGGFNAGPHELWASYQGNSYDRLHSTDPLFDPSNSDKLALTVDDTSPKPVTTTIVLLPSRPTIHVGDTVDLVAHVTQTGGVLYPPGSKVVEFYSSSDCSAGSLGTAPLEADGTATLPTVGSWATVKTYSLCASFVGDTIGVTPGRATLVVRAPSGSGAVATTLDYTGPSTGDYGDDVSLSAKLTDGSSGIAAEPLTLWLGSQSCPAVTGADGTAACTLTIDQTAGSYPVGASFAGDPSYEDSDSPTATFTVTKEESTLALSAPSTVVTGQAVTLSASLREDGTKPVEGRTISFTFEGATHTATTAADGTASTSFISSGSGAKTATASFDGDDYYAGAQRQSTVTVQGRTVLTYTGAASGDFGDPVTLRAHLVDQDGNAVANAPVDFTVGAQTCTGEKTDDSGDVSCTLTPSRPAGAAGVTAHYAGSTLLIGSDAQAPFVVTREETTLTLATPTAALQGTTVTLTATLSEDGTKPVLDGRSVQFTYGGTPCVGTTTAGVATCTFTAGAPGPVDVTATFAQDAYYLAAPAPPVQKLYVYAPTPGGGNFVVGDKSATGAVTFWGNQWSKQNGLSLGAAPSSFKGYALNSTTSCGSAWSTDPGNSTPPPPGPLPKYIAVIVSGSASKQGSQVSGTAGHVVVVETATYDANPGHPGTGTVVASVC